MRAGRRGGPFALGGIDFSVEDLHLSSALARSEGVSKCRQAGCLATPACRHPLVTQSAPETSHYVSATLLIMDNDEATQCTQNVVDPRRMGRNNSGISEADISDVMCILHPCSPAAFNVVVITAEKMPHNVLQNDGFQDYDDGLTQSALEEQETFILNSDGPNQAMDLALRFSVNTINPNLGFVFGRNPRMCDIVLAMDTHKRVSNVHFSIFVNDSGVLMLQDMSTNGTMVDDILLKGKVALAPQTRMLNTGSIIQILSPKPDEVVKFIVRIPSREGHVEEYEAKFYDHMQRMAAAQVRAKGDVLAQRLAVPQAITQTSGSNKAPLVQNQYGMRWGGGDKYNVVGHIGKGAFATVYKLATKSEGQLFAAKELEKRKFMKNGILDRKLDNEMQIMKAISHPNIVQYVDYHDYANHLYIIMEYVPFGDLQQYLQKYGALPEELGKKMAMQVLESLAYLHGKKITHRDIKPDNILLANLDPSQFTVKLSDFGLSKVVQDNDTFLKTFCGTLLYCAPEVFPHYDNHVAGRGQKRPRKGTAQQPLKHHSYSQSVDIWSFGAVLWYSLCIKPPFEGVADNTGRGMFEKIMMTPLDPADLVKQGISIEAVALLTEMLNTDPASRPTPSLCLRHTWFGLNREDAAGGALEDCLLAIPEEDEDLAEFANEPDVSGLSLGAHSGSDGSEPLDEASIHSGSMDFFYPRQSKRFKSEAFAYRDTDEMFDSSPELLHEDIPIILQPTGVEPSQPRPAQRKLFGEISQSALDSVGSLVTPGITQSHNISRQSNSANGAQTVAHSAPNGAVASPSLLGAEELLEDVHMDSPQGTGVSAVAEGRQPATPRTPAEGRSMHHVNGTPKLPDEITPKQPQRAFDRQIKLELTASMFYNPHDKSTHNVEYASKVSGLDFSPDGSMVKGTSLPATTNGSATEDEQGDTDADVEAVPKSMTPPSGVIKPPPPRLGRLVTTPDSFTQITLNLTSRITTWGRLKTNTHVYPDVNEIRVSKRAVELWFHAKGIEQASQTSDWTSLPDLHCIITTQSRQGLTVNGVQLREGEFGRKHFGRVYTGDEIGVWLDAKSRLVFTCEFFHGEGQKRRPKDGPRFVVETENSVVKHRNKSQEQKEDSVDAVRVAA